MRSERVDKHTCLVCRKPFAVAYRVMDADEPERAVAAPCPHCSDINRFRVAAGAARARAYRIEEMAAWDRSG